MRSIKTLSTVVALVIGIFAFAGIGTSVSTTGLTGEAVSSRALYRTHCAECHGNDGRSNTKRGRETEATDLTAPEVKDDPHDKVVRIITNGKGDMPGFKGKLSSGQIASIARYIKNL